MPLQIIRNDITKVRADAIVNTANPEPAIGGGTDWAVYQAAGAEKLLAERKKIGRLHVGEAAVTPAFALHAKYIIHTVGPEWRGGNYGEIEDLAFCYRKPLLMAEQLGCSSIAFPLISTGTYGFPKDRALSAALSAISDFLKESEMDVTLVVFGRESFEVSAAFADHVRQFIDDHYAEEQETVEYGYGSPQEDRRRRRRGDYANQRVYGDLQSYGLSPEEAKGVPVDGAACTTDSLPLEDYDAAGLPQPNRPEPSKPEGPVPPAPVFSASGRPHAAQAAPKAAYREQDLSEKMRHISDTFQERLFRLIDERKLDDTEVYKKANLSRKLFSKIRCSSEYSPAKRTAVALAVALELDLPETEDLLRRAGLALSPSSKFDLIVEYCISNHIYDIFQINALLFQYDQPLLGC